MTYQYQPQSPPQTPRSPPERRSEVPYPDTTRPITVCFSDIIDSTASWSNSEEVMAEAHAILYSKSRALAQKYSGYEVKNLGDGFFLTFSSTSQSLQFCLAFQRELAAVRWSKEIVQWRAQMDREQGLPVHRGKGLTVRLGLHCGIPFSSQIDPVSGRMDYHGNMINIASRIMATANGDEIALSDAAILALVSENSHPQRVGRNAVQLNRVTALERCLRELNEDQFEVERKGNVKLKGIPNELYVTLIRLVR